MKIFHKEAQLGEVLLRFVDSYSEPLILFDPERMEIIYMNQPAKDFWGEHSELSEFFEQQEYRNFIKLIHDCHSIEEQRVISYRKDNGSKGVLLFSLYPVAWEDQRVVFLKFNDITEKIKKKEEKRRRNAQLILQDKLKSIDLVTSSISHEINNICNFMVNNLRITFQAWQDVFNLVREYENENGEFLLGGISSAEIEKIIPKLMLSIMEGITRISDTIDDFRKYIKEGLKSESSIIDVNELVKRVVTILNHHIFMHTENFNLNLQEGLPEIRGNTQKLEQVIINLLINALQALPDRKRGIFLSTGIKGDKIYIEIRDEGIGISKDIMPYIFEPFFSTKYSSGGSGLGLYLSKSIIEEFGGEITIKSEESKGTQIIIYLPCYKTDGKL
ncbi:PAS domain-containing sensor histidine kinase [Thermodesulfovibrio sp. 3907-1M]|uniref:histidine kinase n=1 Tax=Thermodesulfovibrio autotrophicus TaxID=3118333 RepID=A0AAU8GZ59_9BACT